MKRTLVALLTFTVIWAVVVFAAVMVLYHVAPDPVRDLCFDNTGKWYTMEMAR